MEIREAVAKAVGGAIEKNRQESCRWCEATICLAIMELPAFALAEFANDPEHPERRLAVVEKAVVYSNDGESESFRVVKTGEDFSRGTESSPQTPSSEP